MAESRQRTAGAIEIRGDLARRYADVYTPERWRRWRRWPRWTSVAGPSWRRASQRRAARARDRQRLTFLEPDAVIPGNGI